MNMTHLTEDANRVLSLATEEAIRLHAESVRPAHLMLGLIRHGNTGIAVRVIEANGKSIAAVQRTLENSVGVPGQHRVIGPPLAIDSKLALEDAFREAVNTGTTVVDTEHIFLALLHDENGESAAAFRNVGLTGESVKAQIIELSKHSEHR